MNIVTAPALYLLGRIPHKLPYGEAPPAPASPVGCVPAVDPKGCFLMVTILIALAMVAVGLYLAVTGRSGETELSGMSIVLKTTDIGIGLAAFGAMFWLAAGKMILNQHE